MITRRAMHRRRGEQPAVDEQVRRVETGQQPGSWVTTRSGAARFARQSDEQELADQPGALRVEARRGLVGHDTGGANSRARASATRCISPRESVSTGVATLRPTRLSQQLPRPPSQPAGAHRVLEGRGQQDIVERRQPGKRWKSWKTKPTVGGASGRGGLRQARDVDSRPTAPRRAAGARVRSARGAATSCPIPTDPVIADALADLHAEPSTSSTGRAPSPARPVRKADVAGVKLDDPRSAYLGDARSLRPRGPG